MILRRLVAHLSASRWLRPGVVLAMIVITILSVAPKQWQLRTGLPSYIEHFGAFFGVGLLLGVAWPPTRRVVLSFGLLLIAFAGVLETLQIWAPGREAQMIDALINVGGAVTGLAVAVWLRQER